MLKLVLSIDLDSLKGCLRCSLSLSYSLGSVCSRRRLSAADMIVAIVRKHTYDILKFLQIIKELESDKTSLEIRKYKIVKCFQINL